VSTFVENTEMATKPKDSNHYEGIELDWIKRQGRWLKIDAIEKELDMPQGTLKKFVDGNRILTDMWHAKVISWVKQHTNLHK
jgi:hypothetical protein